MMNDDKVMIDLSMLLPEEEFRLTGKITGKRAEYLLQEERKGNDFENFKNELIRFIEDY